MCRVMHEVVSHPSAAEIMLQWCLTMLATSWVAPWTPGEELRSRYPPRHTDFRDVAPDSLEDVVAAYAQYVVDGKWTLGLFDMW